MEHVLNIAFDFDDDKVRKIAEHKVENEMENIIRSIVTDQIAPGKYDYYTRRTEPNWDRFNGKVDNAVTEFLKENKEMILERAAYKIAESLKRTKAWKEKVGELM